MESVSTISISDLVIDPAFQMRCTLSEDAVSDYSEVITSTNAEWPFSTPCSVYRVSGQMILTDGFHRVQAMQKAGRDAIRATVTDGSKSDALIAALGANHSHGLRRTNADKRRAVTMALADELLQAMSDRQLSEVCGTSDMFVAKVRGQLQTDGSCPPKATTGSDGKQRPANRDIQLAQREKITAVVVTADESLSDRKIAEQVGCSHRTVASVRAEISKPKQVAPEPEPEPEVSTLDSYAAIEAIWNSVPDDERASFRDRIACMMGIAPVSSESQALFPDVAAEQKAVGRKKPTDDEFEAFWKAYPRRTEKGNARKAFEKAFTNLREQYSIAEVIEKIMSGVDAYAENADPDYLCHPATWLNGCRWDDEPASIGKVKKKSHSDFGKYDETTADEPW